MIGIRKLCIQDKVAKTHQYQHEQAYRLLHDMLEKEYGYSILNEKKEIKELLFEKTEQGKPFIRGLSIHFSISHCKEMAACAVSSSPIGIDVEQIRPVKENIIQKVLSEEEQERYMIQREKDKGDKCFFQFWTLKESLGKYLGAGLSYPLTSVSFRGLGTDYISIYCTEKKWQSALAYIQIKQWILDERYIVSICQQKEEKKEELVWWN